MNNIYVEDEDEYDNPFKYIDPSKLDSYQKTNSVPSSSSEYQLVRCDEYIRLVNEATQPILYEIFNEKSNYTYKQFYTTLIDNFSELNENELKFISKNFSPKKYEETILKIIMDSELTIDRPQFNSLLQKDFIQDFNDLYLKGSLAKYALDNFSTLNKEEQSQLWQQLKLYLPQNSFFKTYFLNKAIKDNVKISDSVFFKNIDVNTHLQLPDYFNIAVNNQWSENIIYFSKHFYHICLHYLYKDKDFDTKQNINFERLFFYYNPSKINNSHLSEDNLNLVFSKLYESLDNKNLLSKENSKFLHSLDIGIYKLLEVAYKQNPEHIHDFLYSKNDFLLGSSNDSPPVEIIIGLFNNMNKLNTFLQDSFCKNLLDNYLPSILNNSLLQSNIIHRCEEYSFGFKSLVKEDYISNEKKAALIHVLFENYINNPDNDNKVFFNKLNCFPLQSLLTFENYLPFTIHILKLNYKDAEESIDYAEQSFNKILLNAKLNNKLALDTENRQEKRMKI